MIAIAVGMALAAAAFHGTWNVLIKVSGDPITTFRRVTLMTAVVATIPLLPAWLLLGRPALNPAAAGLCFLSGILETAYLWLLSAAYRRGDLSAVYPIARGSAPLLSVLIGLTVLGERLTSPQLIGVALLIPALLTGVAIALYTSVDRVGVRLTTPWIYGWLLFTLMAIGLPLSIWVASALRLYHAPAVAQLPTWRQSALIGTFMWAGYFLVLWALTLAPLAVVAPVRETAVVAVAVWGVWRLRERERAAMKLSGAIATLAGVALLAI